jgi:diguanylate cyclase (GGDEF)-like protein/PAS domain S-box-containing protein
MRRALAQLRTFAAGLALAIVCAVVTIGPAHALKPISVTPDQDRIEITSLGEFYESRGDSLQLEMATANDAVTGRMTVRATTPGTNPNWVAFALQNATDKPIERWLTAERYTMFGSGAIWPDLDARRVDAVTPSLGYVPERIKNDRADIFRITLEPGQTITYVAELSTERFARVYLWKPIDYELKVRDRQLFNGVLLGLTGLLAIFLTAVFAANHKAIFPTAALVAWCVLAHLTVDFGFFHKLFQLRPEDNAVYRAATEAAMAASLVVFLYTFLRLGRSPGLIRMLLGLWIAGQLALVAVAVVDPRLASTFARLSFVAIGAIGALTTVGLALRGQDRALALVPTWLFFLVWVFGAAVILTGRLATDIAVSGLIAGLVLIVVSIGFTVTQFAFRSLEPVYGSTAPSEQQLSALAVDGAGAAIFEWFSNRNEVKVSPIIDGILGLPAGELSSKFADFAKHVHEADRERLRTVLTSVQDRAGAAIRTEFRLRHADNSARWFELEASTMPGADPRSLRFVGLLREITDSKRARERLVHDAVYCSLTGLPNRALFLDRLAVVMARARTDETLRPAIILIDVDKFKSVNATFGLPVGDSLLLTIARRLSRHVSGRHTLARVGGDQFAILFEAEQDPAEFAREAERVRRAVRAPIKIGGQDIVITAALGIAIYDGEGDGQASLLEDAEIATYRAKRSGADKIELFTPQMRTDRAERIEIENDLRKALEGNQLRVLYQPVIYLPTEELAGFEASLKWDHPKLGLINPVNYVPAGGDPALIQKVGSYMLARASQDAARWQKELPRTERPLFVAINIAASALLRPELAREVRQLLDRGVIPKGTLRLEVAESLVMENPEQAGEILEQLRGVGAELSLDDFGAGFSSLAYLQRFPFDTIKIDRWFVQAAAGGDAPGAAVVRSMVALSHELNKKVVADGVELPEDAVFLRQIGCAFAQGFYYGDPMPDRDVLQLLKLVRKSESKLQPRGFFRMTMKRPKIKTPPADAAAVSGMPSGAPVGIGKQGRLKLAAAPVNGQSNGKTNGAAAKPNGAAKGRQSALKPSALKPSSLKPGAQSGTMPPPPMPAGPGMGEMPPSMPIADAHAYEPHPLSSLQAGLDALNARAETPPEARIADLAAVFHGHQPQADHAPAGNPMAELAAAMAMADAPAAPVERPAAEPFTRVRQIRPAPDLSKLPPGLAASLAKLAGKSDSPTPRTPQPPPPPRRPRGTND